MPEYPMVSHIPIFNQLQPIGMVKMIAVSITKKEYPLFLYAGNGITNETKFLYIRDLWI